MNYPHITKDSEGNIIHLKHSNRVEWWCKYDSNNNEIYYKDSDGYERWREYDSNNKLIHSKDTDGNESWYEYDGNTIERPTSNLERELAAVREERDELKDDRDAWKSEALIMDARLRGIKHPNDNGLISPDEVIPKLGRELAAVTEERDKYRGLLIELYNDINVIHSGKAVAKLSRMFRDENYN